MSTNVIKVRSQSYSKKHEIIWEILKFEEMLKVHNTYRNKKTPISECVFDATYYPLKLPMRWSIKLVRYYNEPHYYCRFTVEWDFHNGLEQPTNDVEICAQLQISMLKAQESSVIVGRRMFGLKPKESTMGNVKLSVIKENLPPNGQLTLKVELEQFEPSSSQIVSEIENATIEGASKYLEDFSNLFESGQHSDFIVKIEDGDVFKVHKVILAARSSVLSRMLDSGMEECAKGEMVVKDMISETMRIVLQYIYGGKIEEEKVTVNNVEELAYAADKYDLPLLKEMVNKLMHNFCALDNAMSLWNTSKLYGLKEAEEKIGLFVQQNILEIFKTGVNFADNKQN